MNATTRKDFSIIKKVINAVTSPRASGSKQSVASAIRCIEAMLDVIKKSNEITDDAEVTKCWSCGGPAVLAESSPARGNVYRCKNLCGTVG